MFQVKCLSLITFVSSLTFCVANIDASHAQTFVDNKQTNYSPVNPKASSQSSIAERTQPTYFNINNNNNDDNKNGYLSNSNTNTNNNNNYPSQINQHPSHANHQNARQQLSSSHIEQSSSFQQQDTRIPFWNIGHMINSLELVDQVMKRGANGIETDVSFDFVPDPPLELSYKQQDVHPIKASAFHGLPCDCFRLCYNRADFVEFLKHIKKVTTRPNNTLNLMLLDLKLTTKELNEAKKAFIGDYLAQTLMNILYRNLDDYQNGQTPIRTILSINYVTDHMVVRTFIDRLKHERLEERLSFIGFDVGMNDKLTNITSMWDDLNSDRSLNVWQGDGLTNCANILRKIDRLKEAIAIRNSRGHFKKVYYWTVDVKSQLRNILRLGLDAVLTNQPERIVSVLGEDEFRSKYRLATRYDNPFKQFQIDPLPWKLPNLDEVEETVENIKKTGSEYFKNLPTGIVKALENKVASVIA